MRRKFYLPGSPAGKGAKWEWAGDSDDWHTYDMEVQCLIEEAWARVSEYLLRGKQFLWLEPPNKVLFFFPRVTKPSTSPRLTWVSLTLSTSAI